MRHIKQQRHSSVSLSVLHTKSRLEDRSSLQLQAGLSNTMISASKRSSLRLTLQPFTPSISLSGCPSPRNHMVSISSSTVPCTPRLSPVPDVYMASPTPTRGSFLLTPTRLGSPIKDPRSPVLSVCISEDCSNAVLGERTA